jgi:hypothetical protein
MTLRPTSPLLPDDIVSTRPRHLADRFPAHLRRQVASLVAQQFWLFGCDIRRPEGNLLLTYGFDRCKAPSDSRVTASRYTMRLRTGETVILWGFGLCWSDPQFGDLYLSRHRFVPLIRRHTVIPDTVWDSRDVQGFWRPTGTSDLVRCQTLVTRAMWWLAEYESFVLEVAGEAYRNQAIRAWKKPVGTAAELSHSWRQSAQELALAAGITPPPLPELTLSNK